MIGELEFARPGFLYLLLGIIPLTAWYVLNNNKLSASMKVSTIASVDNMRATFKEILRHVLFGVRMVILALLLLALARPQASDKWENVDTMGIDIMLSLDISSSMLARDFKPDRLTAAKNLAMEFIAGRRNDRIGLVVFSGESFTQCPLTTDHSVLINLFRDVNCGMIEDGTAIGVGLANAVKRLKDSDAASKVVILLTDGVSNQGAIDPITAAELAKTFGIRVYTIGIGSMGTAPYPFVDSWGRTVLQDVEVKIDEETLMKIADLSGGNYYRATSNEKLKAIYKEIDQLEKSKINVKEYSRKEERFMPLVWMALLLLLIEIIIRKTVLRSIP